MGFKNAYSLAKRKCTIYTLTVILCKKLREKGKVILTFEIVKLVGKFLRFPTCKYCNILDFVPEPLLFVTCDGRLGRIPPGNKAI